ncbi:MAG: hypothetical protein K5669_08235 [Lachnospiraceae bacterium]|nr:hypothetical protein [Lachnospiraceae bacterium]
MKKKIASIVLASAMALSLAACGAKDAANEVVEDTQAAVEEVAEEAAEAVTEAAEEVKEEVTEAVETVEEAEAMSYADYAAAELDTEVTVVTYVQAHQSWWEDKVTVYTQDADGAYFLYELACSEEDAAKLTEGTKIKVHGFKSEWSGEVEITDATFEFVEDGDTFVAEATDLTDKLGTDELINYQNQKAAFNGLTVVARESGNAVDYKYDNSGSHDENSDLYFDVQDANGNVYTFTVESYLCDNTTDVYATVEGLNVGDVIDCEGFVYWYEGVNPHITSVTVK